MAEGNDLRNSTITLYYSQRAQSARPAPARVPAGPASKLIGSVHTHAYEERPGAAAAPKPAEAAAPSSSSQQPWTSRTRDTAASRDSLGASGPYKTRKVVYWTGRDHHIVDAPDVSDSRFKWVPPHLKQEDVGPGPQLAVRETPGACRIKLIGSKYRYLPTMEPGGGSMWEVTPKEATLYGSVGSNTWGSGGLSSTGFSTGRLRPGTANPYSASAEAYSAARQRIMGYKEYEGTTKMLNGLGSWERTQRHLTGSMDVGRPSTLRSPAQQAMTASFAGLPRA
ncbi:hypothetical protein HYH02_013861 [Chlamydomonas schloesseri]|uniref:Uncharacterized protein n=1 Tax=Chlamydomonas schloesseri TaxID=2026947 RepID=A0A835VY90_9CHLO|nr:hypothetical protein HYH02_013861 [Chlamydomonas schloesseri]|eukprot:KAG2430034.1 hypothetical protein HYH02_013861 [Chlamydomonas schloesseri]